MFSRTVFKAINLGTGWLPKTCGVPALRCMSALSQPGLVNPGAFVQGFPYRSFSTTNCDQVKD